MPVDDHPVHERTKIGEGFRYGCFNRAPLKPYYEMIVTDYTNYGGHAGLAPMVKRIPFRMSTDCKYDLSVTDPACTGCKWRDK